jgi:hypothetical protein
MPIRLAERYKASLARIQSEAWTPVRIASVFVFQFRADHQSKQSCRISITFIISELIHSEQAQGKGP